jgi:hypothetical protein
VAGAYEDSRGDREGRRNRGTGKCLELRI